MKKLAAVVAGLGLGMSVLATSAWSQTDLNTIATDVTVEGLFGLTLDPASAISFGSLANGVESAPQIIGCEARSNHGLAWVIQLNAAPLTHTDGVTQIPPANFKYFFTNDAPGTEVPLFTTNAPVPATPTTIYTAAASEFNTNFTGFGLGFLVIIDGTQKSGTYNTTLNISMVDSF